MLGSISIIGMALLASSFAVPLSLDTTNLDLHESSRQHINIAERPRPHYHPASQHAHHVSKRGQPHHEVTKGRSDMWISMDQIAPNNLPNNWKPDHHDPKFPPGWRPANAAAYEQPDTWQPDPKRPDKYEHPEPTPEPIVHKPYEYPHHKEKEKPVPPAHPKYDRPHKAGKYGHPESRPNHFKEQPHDDWHWNEPSWRQKEKIQMSKDGWQHVLPDEE